MKIGITCYPSMGGSGIIATELGIKWQKGDMKFTLLRQIFLLEFVSLCLTLLSIKSKKSICSISISTI